MKDVNNINNDAICEATEKIIDHLAFMRRMAELEGCDMEAFDEKINEYCTKYHDMYANMGEAELAFKGMMDIIQAGHGEELMRGMFGGDEE